MTDILLQLGILIGGFVLLIKGADLFVRGASAIAWRFGVPQLVIGLTVVALGTSAPEAAVSISAALTGNGDITVGNVLGSNIINVLVILGVTAIVAPVAVEKAAIRVDIPFMLGVSLLILPLGLTGESIGLMEGIIFVVLFIGYMIYLFMNAKKDSSEKLEPELESGPQRPTRGKGNLWTYLGTLAGLVMIVLGSRFTVMAATEIALDLGVSQRMIGLTIVAFGTSLPELVTSAVAAHKGNAGIAMGNIVGSNIFNILFVTGITAVITPIRFAPEFLLDGIIAAAAALLLWLLVFRTKRLGRVGGGILLAGYAAYFTVLMVG